jgi:parvulin-like peptidyl-prolyl isomerase
VPASAKLNVPAVAELPATDPVVATVDERPIRASEVALQARTAHQSAKQALDDLIDTEVLAGEARRRKVQPDAEQLDEVRAAAVRALLKSDYERETTVASVPERDVVRFYNKNRGNFDHGEHVVVLHILVPIKGLPPDKKAAAKQRAEELAKKARGVGSPDAFRALAKTGETIEEIETARDGWVEKPFSEAAFDQLKKPGDTTGVVETSYGYHVEYLLRFIPAEHKSVTDVADQIRAYLFPGWQRQHFLDWVTQLSKSHDVVVHAERLKK